MASVLVCEEKTFVPLQGPMHQLKISLWLLILREISRVVDILAELNWEVVVTKERALEELKKKVVPKPDFVYCTCILSFGG